MHTGRTTIFLGGNENLKKNRRSVVVVRVVTLNRGNYCIGRLGVLHPSHAKQRCLLARGRLGLTYANLYS